MAEQGDKKSRPDLGSVKLEVMKRLKGLGSGFSGLLERIRSAGSLDSMKEKLKDAEAANAIKHSEVSEKLAEVAADIKRKKILYEKATPAEKNVLKDNLRMQLSRFNGLKRQASVFSENIRILSGVIGRINEIAAYKLAGPVSEDMIDEVADVIEEHAAEAEGRAEASRDLEKAGKRRDIETAGEDFESLLAEFDEESIPGLDPEDDSSRKEDAAREKKKKDKQDSISDADE